MKTAERSAGELLHGATGTTQVPSLLDCRRIFLRDYEVAMNIGVHSFEKNCTQLVCINVDVYVALSMSTPTRDELNEVMDYDIVHKVISEVCSERHIHLQETLCDTLSRRLLANSRVRAVRIQTEKLSAYANCRSAGCEVFVWNAQGDT